MMKMIVISNRNGEKNLRLLERCPVPKFARSSDLLYHSHVNPFYNYQKQPRHYDMALNPYYEID